MIMDTGEWSSGKEKAADDVSMDTYDLALDICEDNFKKLQDRIKVLEQSVTDNHKL